jgi:hypothetical protein
VVAVAQDLGLAMLPSFAKETIGLLALLRDAPKLMPDLWMLVHEHTAMLACMQLVKIALVEVGGSPGGRFVGIDVG